MTSQTLASVFGSNRVLAMATFAAAVLAFLALDDITTDADSSFALERAGLVVCGVWFALMGWHLVRRGRLVLGAVSLAAVAAGALAQPAIGPGTVASQWEYLAVIGCLAWFVVLGGVLAGALWRPTPEIAR